MKKTLFALTVTLFAGSAFAAPAHWGGPYMGASLGHGSGAIKDQGNPNASGHRLEGATAGGHGGYNWQFENDVVLGLEGGFALNSIGRHWKDRENNPYSPYHGRETVKRAGYLAVNLGYAVGNALPYVTGGLTVARTLHSLGCDRSLVERTQGCRVAEFTDNAAGTSVGGTLGAGVLYKVSDTLAAGVEYKYTNLGTRSVHLEDPNYPAASKRKMNAHFATTTLKLNYLF